MAGPLVVTPALLQVVDLVRSIAGPSIVGDVPTQLSIITRTWAGSRRMVGPSSDSTLTLPQWYFVKQLKTEEIVNSGGRYESGDVIVGPITPSFTTATGSGGFSEAQLQPLGANNVDIIYQLTGNHQGEYQLIELRSYDPTEYWVVLRRRRTTPSVV